MTQQTLFDVAPSFVNRSTKAVTFQGKLDLPIHRWYRLTPSFSPRLAADIVQQSNPIIQRYRTVWVVKQGMESYEMVQEMSGYDFYGFLRRNKEDFQKPILKLLRSLTA